MIFLPPFAASFSAAAICWCASAFSSKIGSFSAATNAVVASKIASPLVRLFIAFIRFSLNPNSRIVDRRVSDAISNFQSFWSSILNPKSHLTNLFLLSSGRAQLRAGWCRRSRVFEEPQMLGQNIGIRYGKDKPDPKGQAQGTEDE